MKILKKYDGTFSNFEVLAYLKDRSATKERAKHIVASEEKVLDYLNQTAACNQSMQVIGDFLAKIAKFKLTKSEQLNIINTRPTSLPEIFPIIDKYSERFKDYEPLEEMLEIVVSVLPLPPEKPE
ncbi:hypothetical protein ZOSMA_83G00270 [Zostera marina]|uniref:DNA-directed RNA polymerase III subunit RPC9 n=1 Tax=Zostera marina TaxID=29655 RepID=A0A0K9NNL3_ZOSMR|nr:hypothetical protein ZOSMA_83G00270 [Zostera marina]